MKNERIKGILAVIIYFVLSTFSGVFLALCGINTKNWSDLSKFIFSVAYETALVLIIILLLRKTIVNDFKIWKKDIKKYLREYIKYWFIALGLMGVANIILSLFNGGNVANNEQSVRELFNLNPILMLFFACIIAPVLEELVFRISFRKIIHNNYLFIFLSGFIFGLMHVIGSSNNIIDWLYIIPYGIPGCVFAYTLVKSNNSMVPISLHAIHNTFAMILQIIVFISK